MNITLRAGERLFINGAVIRTDRKATIELLNDATFLLETHVMQASDATSPLRQIYFVIQVMLMDPPSAKSTAELALSLIEKALTAFENPEVRTSLRNVIDLIGRGRFFEAMKSIRSLYVFEQKEMYPEPEISTKSNAA
jgi:flagellar biosynthesis repressor protein FlbT